MRVHRRVQIVTGMVVLDTDAYDRMELRGDERSEEPDPRPRAGHVLGLDHVDDIGELMNAELTSALGRPPKARANGLRASALRRCFRLRP